MIFRYDFLRLKNIVFYFKKKIHHHHKHCGYVDNFASIVIIYRYSQNNPHLL